MLSDATRRNSSQGRSLRLIFSTRSDNRRICIGAPPFPPRYGVAKSGSLPPCGGGLGWGEILPITPILTLPHPEGGKEFAAQHVAILGYRVRPKARTGKVPMPFTFTGTAKKRKS